MMKKFILGAGGGGRTALSILERNNIDNILLDLGLDILSILVPGEYIPVIALSGLGGSVT